MVKKKAYLSLERGEGEGYMEYPSPQFGLGFTQSSKRYFIDTTDFSFNQGDFTIREEVSLVSAGAMSSVWACEVMGSWICSCLF
jgi:hypothetical protein